MFDANFRTRQSRAAYVDRLRILTGRVSPPGAA